ncbi:MAG: hypothetical protein ACTS4U_00510 [Candidatus Hodgkinia cicadicola]
MIIPLLPLPAAFGRSEPSFSRHFPLNLITLKRSQRRLSKVWTLLTSYYALCHYWIPHLDFSFKLT